MHHFRKKLKIVDFNHFWTVWNKLWTEQEFFQNRALHQFKALTFSNKSRKIKNDYIFENVHFGTILGIFFSLLPFCLNLIFLKKFLYHLKHIMMQKFIKTSRMIK